MDDLTLMRSFRAERVTNDEAARAEAWRALEARFAATSAAPVAIPARRRGLLSRRRRLLVFAGATALAAVVAGIVVLSSGPTAQPAAAEVLHRTAEVAAATDAPAPVPGPGQFLYKKFERLELEGWIPVEAAGEDEPTGLMGGVLHQPGAFNALIPTKQEWWTAADGAGRVREVAGTPRFLTKEEQRSWEAAGSRLPPPFDPAYQRKYPLAYGDALEAGRGVVDTEHAKLEGFRFPDTSELPTDPAALRQEVEANTISVSGFNLMYPEAKRLDTEQTTTELLNILAEGNPMTSRLQAALFNALAEVPGIEVKTDAADFLGRKGYAIRSIDPKSGGGSEFIFDPDTAAVLAQREFIGDPQKIPSLQGLPAGLTVRETDYLETAVVDSSGETGAEAAAGKPVASASR